MALASLRKVSKSYRLGTVDVPALQEVDLELHEGRFTVLCGPSGSGKTTLLNLIAGIDRPTSGSLRIDGHELTRMSRGQLAAWRSRYVGYVFQLYNLVPTLTAYENVELPLLLHPLTRRERHHKVALALELVALADRANHFPRQLSGGQEQRVAIARAIVADPHIIVADEPTGDLDAPSAQAIMALLTRLNQELHKTLVMVTHDAHCSEYARRVVHLDKGKLVEGRPRVARPLETAS